MMAMADAWTKHTLEVLEVKHKSSTPRGLSRMQELNSNQVFDLMLLVRAARPCANTNEEKGWKRIVSKRSWTTFLLVTNCIVWHAQKATSQTFSAWVRINVLEIVGMSQLQPQYACKCWQSWHRFADKLLCQIGRKWGSCRWGYSVTTFKRNPNTQGDLHEGSVCHLFKPLP